MSYEHKSIAAWAAQHGQDPVELEWKFDHSGVTHLDIGDEGIAGFFGRDIQSRSGLFDMLTLMYGLSPEAATAKTEQIVAEATGLPLNGVRYDWWPPLLVRKEGCLYLVAGNIRLAVAQVYRIHHVPVKILEL